MDVRLKAGLMGLLAATMGAVSLPVATLVVEAAGMPVGCGPNATCVYDYWWEAPEAYVLLVGVGGLVGVSVSLMVLEGAKPRCQAFPAGPTWLCAKSRAEFFSADAHRFKFCPGCGRGVA